MKCWPYLCANLLLALVVGHLRDPLSLTKVKDGFKSYGDETILKVSSQVLNLKDNVPVAVLHGMGDSCYNPGMKQIVEIIQSQLSHDEVVCVSFGKGYEEDTLNYFKLTMNSQVEVFAESVKKQFGSEAIFDSVGISQGNLIVRAYVQRYNHNPGYPTVRRFISIHGPMLGVAAVPTCNPSDAIIGFFCSLLADLTGEVAYTDFIQSKIAQANYLREPMLIEKYLTTEFLPFLNFERKADDMRGMESLEQIVLVKAERDTTVLPPGSEWFEFYKDGSYSIIETFTETSFFKENSFGLKTLHEAGKVHFESTPGGHVQFSERWLIDLINKYWI